MKYSLLALSALAIVACGKNLETQKQDPLEGKMTFAKLSAECPELNGRYVFDKMIVGVTTDTNGNLRFDTNTNGHLSTMTTDGREHQTSATSFDTLRCQGGLVLIHTRITGQDPNELNAMITKTEKGYSYTFNDQKGPIEFVKETAE